jgi:ribosome-binding factor A
MGQRASRVAEELRKIVTQILLEDLSDPRLGFVTVTRVDVTVDPSIDHSFRIDSILKKIQKPEEKPGQKPDENEGA